MEPFEQRKWGKETTAKYCEGTDGTNSKIE